MFGEAIGSDDKGCGKGCAEEHVAEVQKETEREKKGKAREPSSSRVSMRSAVSAMAVGESQNPA
jgi:hypothetical protein